MHYYKAKVVRKCNYLCNAENKKVSIRIRYCIKSIFQVMREAGLGRDLPLSKKFQEIFLKKLRRCLAQTFLKNVSYSYMMAIQFLPCITLQ